MLTCNRIVRGDIATTTITLRDTIVLETTTKTNRATDTSAPAASGTTSGKMNTGLRDIGTVNTVPQDVIMMASATGNIVRQGDIEAKEIDPSPRLTTTRNTRVGLNRAMRKRHQDRQRTRMLPMSRGLI